MEPDITLYRKAEDLKRLNFINSHIRENIDEGDKVLDVGCGNGNVSLFLGQKGVQVKGIDISAEAIAIAKARNPFSYVEFEVCAAEKLSDIGERYKAVVCSEVLEHLDEPHALLEVLYELLTDDGILIVTVPNGYGPREVFMTKPMQHIQKNGGLANKAIKSIKSALGYKGSTVQSAAENLTHVQFFSLNTLKQLAQRARFSIQQISNANFIDAVFPVSLVTNRITALQKVDCTVADYLPHGLTSGFYTVWTKQNAD